MPETKTLMQSAHRQMGAVIAKLMESFETMPFLRSLHPLEFDRLRKRTIQGMWDAYNIGLWLGQKSGGDHEIHESEY